MHPAIRRQLSRRGGFTVIEGTVAAALLCLVIVGTVVLFTSTCRLWRVGSSGTDANTYGSLAMRRLVTEIQEGRSAYVSGSRLVVRFPYYDSVSGSYQKDSPGATVSYYLSGETGTELPEANGSNYLWKETAGSRTRLARCARSFEFAVTSDELVTLRIWGADTEGARINPDLIRQSVRLRNY